MTEEETKGISEEEKDKEEEHTQELPEKEDWELKYKQLNEEYTKYKSTTEHDARSRGREELMTKYEIPEENKELFRELFKDDQDDEKQLKEKREKFPHLFKNRVDISADVSKSINDKKYEENDAEKDDKERRSTGMVG